MTECERKMEKSKVQLAKGRNCEFHCNEDGSSERQGKEETAQYYFQIFALLNMPQKMAYPRRDGGQFGT